MTNTQQVAVLGQLQAYGIRTIGDIDDWCNAQRDRPSRYEALKSLVGEEVTVLILNELAVLQWQEAI